MEWIIVSVKRYVHLHVNINVNININVKLYYRKKLRDEHWYSPNCEKMAIVTAIAFRRMKLKENLDILCTIKWTSHLYRQLQLSLNQNTHDNKEEL